MSTAALHKDPWQCFFSFEHSEIRGILLKLRFRQNSASALSLLCVMSKIEKNFDICEMNFLVLPMQLCVNSTCSRCTNSPLLAPPYKKAVTLVKILLSKFGSGIRLVWGIAFNVTLQQLPFGAFQVYPAWTWPSGKLNPVLENAFRTFLMRRCTSQGSMIIFWLRALQKQL